MKKRSFAFLLALLLALGLTACGGSSQSSSAAAGSAFVESNKAAAWDAPAAPMEEPVAEEDYWAGDEAAASAASEESSRQSLPDGVKMIYRANLELETTEFEQAASQIKTLTAQLGGYFEEQNAYNRSGGYRSASYVVRVPAERFEEFLTQIGSVCTVVRQGQSAEDVSEYYYDMESRLETAKIKLDRLQELLSRAEEMEDIITLESAISETEYQIERLSGEKRHYDALIGYSTINVTLSEVYRVAEIETAPLTFSQRIGAAFRDGLRSFVRTMEDLAEWLAYSWLTLLFIALIAAVFVKLIRGGLARRAPGEKRGFFRKKSKNPPTDTPEELKK